MHVTGACFCGHVKYEAIIDERKVFICHCTSCQRHSGTAYGVVAGMDLDSFKLLSGEMKTHEQIADSGRLRARTFCPECGTRIYAATPGDATSFSGLRVGTVDQRTELKPRLQVWCRSALPWALLDGLPRVEKQPGPEDIARLLDE